MLAYNDAEIPFEWPTFRKETPSMIAYVTVGADDIARAERFYSAFLPALGYELEEYHGDLSYVLPAKPGQSPVQPDFYVKTPFDGTPASAGNGSMVAFEARNQRQVRDLHAAALAAGRSLLVGPLDSADTRVTLTGLKTLGVGCGAGPEGCLCP